MTEPLFAKVRPGSSEDLAIRDHIAERRSRIVADLSSINCEVRQADIYRGRLAELADIEHALTPHAVPSAEQ